MRRRKLENQIERNLLIALIVSKDFLSQSAQVLHSEKDLLKNNPLFLQIATWCLDYWTEYHKAPGVVIESVYHKWADKNEGDPLIEDIHELLEQLSGQYEEHKDLNVPYLLDSLSEFLTKLKLNYTQEGMEAALARGDIKAASSIIGDYRTVQVGKTEGASPLNQKKVWKRAFSASSEPIIHFSGPAGRFFNSALTRDALIGIQAPEKRGKTYWCIELLFRALQERRKVAFFQVGDLSEAQVVRRLASRLTGLPELKRDCKKVLVPTQIERDEDETVGSRVTYEKRKFPAPISYARVQQAIKQFKKAYGLPEKENFFKISVHPNSTINIKGIEGILDQWEQEEGFVPDVILIDYADILAPEEERKEGRDMINDTWKAARRLSQVKHALVIMPTQANAASYDVKTQSMKHFSNDKRKLAHVNGMFALNQTDDEKEAQVMRINWIVLRSCAFNVKRCLYVGQCLTLARALCVATL